MEDRQQARQTEQTDEQKALERERLGGPADYDEAGGTGLQGDSAASDESSPATEESRSGSAGERARQERQNG